MATGPMHWLKLHETHMQGVDFFINAIAPSGQHFQQGMKGMLEPVMLYRFIFPRDALPMVANTLKEEPNDLKVFNAQAWALRKAINLQKIPEFPSTNARMPVSLDHVRVMPIGIKDDGDDRVMITGVKQEPL